MRSIHKHAICGLLCGFLNGILGAGGGMIAVPFLERIFGLEPVRAHATAISIILPLTLVSAIFYANRVDIPIDLLVTLSLSGTLGGWLGARLLPHMKNRWLKIIFGFSMVLAAARMF